MNTLLRRCVRDIYKSVPCKRELFVLTRRLYTPPESVYRHLHFTGPFTVRVGGRAFRMIHHGYVLENEIFWEAPFGRSQRWSLRLWADLCRTSKVIFDVGANTGVFALVARTVQPGSTVYAFEPVRAVFDKLVANVRLNGFDIRARQVAISDHVGQAVLHRADGVYVATLATDGRQATGATEATEVTTLAAVIEQEATGRVDLMKIDVEGHEPAVLQGLSHYLDDLPTLLIEITRDERAAQLEMILGGRDYLFFDIDEANGPVRQRRLRASSRCNFLICSEPVARRHGLL